MWTNIIALAFTNVVIPGAALSVVSDHLGTVDTYVTNRIETENVVETIPIRVVHSASTGMDQIKLVTLRELTSLELAECKQLAEEVTQPQVPKLLYLYRVNQGFVWTNGWVIGCTDNDRRDFAALMSSAENIQHLTGAPESSIPVTFSDTSGTSHTLTLDQFRVLMKDYALHILSLIQGAK